MSLPPSTSSPPLIGDLFNFLGNHNYPLEKYDLHGGIFRTKFFSDNVVFLSGEKAAQFLLTDRYSSFSAKEGFPPTFEKLIGKALFTQEGALHASRRRLMFPKFSPQILPLYYKAIESSIENSLIKWTSADKILFYRETKALSLEIVFKILFGTDVESDSHFLSQLCSELMGGLASIPVISPKWNKSTASRSKLRAYLHTLIDKRRNSLNDDLISILISAKDENGSLLSDSELVDYAVMLLIAGHETTAIFLTWAIVELLANPDIWLRARQEQISVKETGFESLKSMPYLDNVLLEVERLHPPVESIFRRSLENIYFDNYLISKGWLVYFSVYLSHQLPNVYSHPEVFNPERFAKESKQLFGFGLGERLCLGKGIAKMEAKLFLSTLLRNYEINLIPNQSFERKSVVDNYPKDNLIVSLKKS